MKMALFTSQCESAMEMVLFTSECESDMKMALFTSQCESAMEMALFTSECENTNNTKLHTVTNVNAMQKKQACTRVYERDRFASLSTNTSGHSTCNGRRHWQDMRDMTND